MPTIHNDGSRTQRMLLWAVVAIAVCAPAGIARAQSGDVESLLAQGIELRRKGQPDRALVYFQKAYDLERSPRTEGQLGLAQMAAGMPVDAEKHLDAALASPRDPWVAKYKTAMQDVLGKLRKQLGDVVVEGGPSGATVSVNGRQVGVFPLGSSIRVAAGKVEIEISAAEHASATRSITITGGEKQTVTVALEKAPAPQPTPGDGASIATLAPAGPAPGPGPAAPSAGSQPSIAMTPETAPSSSGMRTAAWAVGVGAVAALGAGVGLQLAARSKLSDFNRECVLVGGVPMAMPLTGVQDSSCASRYDSWDSQKRWSIVGYVAGSALAVTSGVLFWLSSSSGSRGGVASARVTCAPGLGGVACQGEF